MEFQGCNGVFRRGAGASYPSPVAWSSRSKQATVRGILYGYHAIDEEVSGIEFHLELSSLPFANEFWYFIFLLPTNIGIAPQITIHQIIEAGEKMTVHVRTYWGSFYQ